MIHDDLPMKNMIRIPTATSNDQRAIQPQDDGGFSIVGNSSIVISMAGFHIQQSYGGIKPTNLWGYHVANLWNNGRWAKATKHVWYGLGCMLMNHPHGFALCFLGAPDSTSRESVGQMHLVRDKTTITWLLCGWAFKAPFQTLLLLGGTESLLMHFHSYSGWLTCISPIF